MKDLHKGIVSIEKALDNGQVFQAHNLASELLLGNPSNLRLSQLNVISLNRLGQSEKALEQILLTVKEDNKDGETLGLLGRTYKDLFKKTNKKSYLELSANAYLKGFQHAGDSYPAINAAELFYILGEREKAQGIAKEVLAITGSSQDYWTAVTVAEAELLLGNQEKALSTFQYAVDNHAKQFGKFQSTYDQLQFLQKHMPINAEILEIFPRPNIAVFSGHMIDAPNRENKRFPAEIEKDVNQQLKQLVKKLDIDIGFTSSASGSDILFIEILKEKGAEIKSYLPFRKEDFLETSVSFAGLGWINRFEDCYDCHPKYLTTEPYLDTPDLFHHLGKVMMGECLLLADQYDVKPYFLSVLAPNQIYKTGGTKALVDLWPYNETHHNVDPIQFIRHTGRITSQKLKSQPAKKKQLAREISHILFADIVGFSKLKEEEIPNVIIQLFKKIKDSIIHYKPGIKMVNTWGDALLICHDDPNALIQIAQDALKLFDKTRLEELNLPQHLNIRIALHSGPVFMAKDPLTEAANAYGSSINRTARMEPVTLPGNIFASDQFAAILKLESPDKYAYQHVGIIELPKGFGKQEVYRIQEIEK